jgi:hypothetical protein
MPDDLNHTQLKKKRIIHEINDDEQPSPKRTNHSKTNPDLKKVIENMDEQSIRRLLLDTLDKDPNTLHQILGSKAIPNQPNRRDQLEKKLGDFNKLEQMLNQYHQKLFKITQENWTNGHEQQFQSVNDFCGQIYLSCLVPIRELSVEYQYGFDICQQIFVRISDAIIKLRRIGTQVAIDSDMDNWESGPPNQSKEFLFHFFKTWYVMLISAEQYRRHVSLETLLDWVAIATERDTYGHLKRVRNEERRGGEADNLFDYTLCQISIRSFKQDPTWYQFHKILFEGREEHQEALKKGMIEHLKGLAPPKKEPWMKSKYQLQPLFKQEAADTVLVKILIKERRLHDAITFAELRDAQEASDANELLLLCASYAVAEDEKWVFRKARIMLERLCVVIPKAVKTRVTDLLNQRWGDLAIANENATEEQIQDMIRRLDEAYAREQAAIERYMNNFDEPISVDEDSVEEIEPYEFPDCGQMYLRWSKLAQCVCGIMKINQAVKQEEVEEAPDTINPFLPSEAPIPKQNRVLSDGRDSWSTLLSRLCISMQKEAGRGLLRAASALYQSETFYLKSSRNEDHKLGLDLLMVLRMTNTWFEKNRPSKKTAVPSILSPQRARVGKVKEEIVWQID